MLFNIYNTILVPLTHLVFYFYKIWNVGFMKCWLFYWIEKTGKSLTLIRIKIKQIILYHITKFRLDQVNFLLICKFDEMIKIIYFIWRIKYLYFKIRKLKLWNLRDIRIKCLYFKIKREKLHILKIKETKITFKSIFYLKIRNLKR